MVDRIAEIREAFERVGRPPGEMGTVEAILGAPEDLNTILDAARAYADLLDSDALIIRRDARTYNEQVTERLMLAQVLSEQVEYAPGLWAWQMETEIRDLFTEILDAALASSQGVEP